MGITDQGLEFLLFAKRHGVAFDRTLTIGRQFVLVGPDRLAEMLPTVAALPLSDGPYPFAEPLLAALGATEVCSVDASDFEGATHVHDLNVPVPPPLFQRFSVVLDGGCLEHVFNFPTAIRSCMQMVEVGGHLLSMPPVNDAAGHGFYQFSPELYFRVLSPENGFVVDRMFLAEVGPGAIWYRVVDPAVAGRRIEFTTRHPAYLYILAHRVDDRPPLVAPPVQSDYGDLWRSGRQGDRTPDDRASPDAVPPSLVELLRRVARRHPAIHVPIRRCRTIVGRYHRWRRPYDPAHFESLGPRLS